MSASTLVRDTEARARALQWAFDGATPPQVALGLQHELGFDRDASVAFALSLEQELAAADGAGQLSILSNIHAMGRGERDQKGLTALLECARARCGWGQLDADKRKALAEGHRKRWGTLRVVGG